MELGDPGIRTEEIVRERRSEASPYRATVFGLRIATVGDVEACALREDSKAQRPNQGTLSLSISRL